jgi:uncharacterized RDD family membrane protein YckC
MTGQLYIQSVIDHVPHGSALRSHIALELQSHIAERVEQGYPLDEIVRQLGDPLTLAESYLAAVPLESAGITRRVVAKIVDVATIVCAVATLVLMLWFVVPREGRYFLPVAGILVCIVSYGVYSAVTEYHFGWTLGKHLMNLVVVRESGARISLGQAVLRQLPFFFQFFWIDALFALFTDRRQRAFELLSKTRTIEGPAPRVTSPAPGNHVRAFL